MNCQSAYRQPPHRLPNHEVAAGEAESLTVAAGRLSDEATKPHPRGSGTHRKDRKPRPKGPGASPVRQKKLARKAPNSIGRASINTGKGNAVALGQRPDSAS